MTAVADPKAQQCRDALDRANEVRCHVAEFKREIVGLTHDDAVSAVIDALENRYSEPLLGAAKVRYLLLSIHRIGATKAAKLLQVSQIYNPDKRLRDLTRRQRNMLVAVLREQGWRA